MECTPARDKLSLQWIFRGNVIVPTGNPFTDRHETINDDSVTWLGPCLQLLVDHVLTVNQDGMIQHLESAASFLTTHQCHSMADLVECVDSPSHVIQLDARTEFLCPGLIDLHIHAPQYAFTGTATDRPLMGPNGWLETYTFPAESRLTDLDVAHDVYDSVVATTIRHGTTTAVYFATLHLEPCRVLVDRVVHHGQRALVGKVCMDRHAPPHYLQSVEQNVNETHALIQYIHDRAGKRKGAADGVSGDTVTASNVLPLVLPLVTPRFLPTCTPRLLTALGEIAAQYNCHVTTHISESHDEVAFSQYLDTHVDYPNETNTPGTPRSDADILDSHSLLTDQCILAHGVHLSERDCDLLRRRGSAVAHCPLSNVFFAGGMFPCARTCRRGNHVGLGTDVAGGYSPSLWHSSRMAVLTSHLLQTDDANRARLDSTSPQLVGSDADSHVMDYRHALYLATLGGARALGLHDSIGTLAVGMEFDALVLSAGTTMSPVQVFATDTTADIVQKICVLGDDRNITQVFVQGRRIKGPG